MQLVGKMEEDTELYSFVERLRTSGVLSNWSWRRYLVRCLTSISQYLRGDLVVATARQIFASQGDPEFEHLLIQSAGSLEREEESLWSTVLTLRDKATQNWPVSMEVDDAWIRYLSAVSVRHVGLQPPQLCELPHAMSSLVGWSSYPTKIELSQHLSVELRDEVCVRCAIEEEANQLRILKEMQEDSSREIG
jgi:hypothetical protein